jgi:hypothetical protein
VPRPTRTAVGCTVEGCKKPHEARGLCVAHYRRWQLYGDPQHVVGRKGGPKFTPAILERAGLTRRQLDYWCQRGLLRCPIVNKRRMWPHGEIRTALLLQKLSDAGLSLERAGEVARATISGEAQHSLAPGVLLIVTEAAEAKSLPKF